MKIIPLAPEHFDQVIPLANLVHGDNYLDQKSISEMYKKGLKSDINASFVALDETGKLLGFRTSYAPGQWLIDKWCSPDLWPVKQGEMAYFKCIAIAPDAQGKGIGPKLLQHAIAALKAQGATAGIAHLWKQSPGNAAVKYFTKAGGKLIKVHNDKWLDDCLYNGYVCTICGTECHCQAAEMVIEF
ncbi:GNAT family N-acetyltransferase (plasmid) [Pseudoalteromonas sp. T1lg65]|uniref:GNAT family N-acetyltransferase n=1 Tax=Pseudoalteromonas sp. T1lg65 TaxID=2077101 RepID=UPI003F7A5289